MAKILDIEETLRQIVKDEDARGRLKEDYFSDGVKEASKELRQLREKYRKKKSVDERLQIQMKSEQLANMKSKEVEERVAHIKKKVEVSINDALEVNGKTVYQCDNLETLLVSKYVMHDLVENYHIQTGDRNAIVEELYVLLNNNTPKVLVRSDIKSFFESIPQEPLMRYLEEDARISTYSLKYLRVFFDRYNAVVGAANPDAEIGVGLPRGLCFSSVLSEIYLMKLDSQIRTSIGVYFYKRYVDDIIMLVSPNVDVAAVVDSLRNTLLAMSLRINEEKTEVVKVTEETEEPISFTYLGYKFVIHSGSAELHLSDRKFEKYKSLIDGIFDVFNSTCHYRSKKANGSKKQDAFVVLKRELNVLTGNGSLTKKKNFIKTGVYYSNKLLTNTERLQELDQYLAAKIDALAPARNLFQYNGEDQYDARVAGYRNVLHKYTFLSGFEQRRTCYHDNYAGVLSILKKIYNRGNE